MSDETYYTILNVKETASASEIKKAYHDLIKQVHPDTITNLAPYLRKIAEDKAKEITEAYGVLSNSSKRQDYDRQLAAYRRQSAPPTPQAPPTPPQQPSQCPICGRSDGGHSAACLKCRTSQASTSSGPYCNKCGTSLNASGFCLKCNKFATPVVTRPQPKTLRWLGYNWAPLLRWSREHPLVVISIPIASFWVIASLSGSNTSPQANTSCLPSQKVEVNGKFVCPSSVPVSQASVAAPVSTDSAVASPTSPSKSIVSVSGTYLGTVHNQTANLSSSFAVVLHQTKDGVLEGCMEVKPPLYGSGALHGSISGFVAEFVVADITFRGDASKNTIVGSYVVSNGKQLGDFRLEKRKERGPQYRCNDAVLTEVPKEVTSPDVLVVPPEELPSARSKVIYAIVISDYASIDKRCAFLPSDNSGRCNYEPETIARPRKSDRLTVLSPLTRSEDGEDIYKVRTAQGWVGWINSRFVEVE